MNGPEHYAEAEHLLNHAEENALEHSPEWYANAVAAAQVHATLALAAATAAGQATAYDGDERHERSRGWAGVA